MPRACYRAGRRTFEARRSLPSRMNNRCDCMMIDIRSVNSQSVSYSRSHPRAHPIDIIWYYTGTRYGFLTNFLCIQHSERQLPSSHCLLIAQPPTPLPAQLRILAPPQPPESGSASAWAHCLSKFRERPKRPLCHTYATPRPHAKEYAHAVISPALNPEQGTGAARCEA